ncbi:hypothetical protein C8P65_10626 [Capnocytophaga leadbetteri]|jgi:hypothetical protein|uniref:Uncharacterized protein n=1 Tax=Capnocytophaga leadbetteri TaxID=327575 RepID=A0A2T5XU96_9FLAO|nr:DUF6331 family protein [Capnocytophaga leadbetteri]PTX06849.1 hypothetical protein C8P65_10626 [Capnocytophaga leadbetteri]
MSILIGNNLFIEELPIDYNGKLLDLDPYIAPLNAFFDKLEVECVRECCGIEAFSFMPENIHKALVGLSSESIVTQLKAMQTAIEEQWWYNTVGSTILNNNFDKKVFLQLLAHIIKTIEDNTNFLGE